MTVPKIIRRGDVWDLLTNTGILRRWVRSVACDTVYYVNADGHMVHCSLPAFRRWAKAAWLTSADDWTGRETCEHRRER
jgi:hypothetical protein